VIRKGKRFGFECKYEQAPRTTRSMHSVMEDLQLERLWVICPGNTAYPLTKQIEVLPLNEARKALTRIGR